MHILENEVKLLFSIYKRLLSKMCDGLGDFLLNYLDNAFFSIFITL